MKTAQELYPGYEAKRHYWSPPGDYQPILDDIGTVVVQVTEDGYEGDSWVLYRDGERYGYLEFGWGSCTGCDRLQGCDSWEDVEELRKELADAVRWFDDADLAMDFFYTHDWEGDYSGSKPEQKEFVEKASAVLLRALGH